MSYDSASDKSSFGAILFNEKSSTLTTSDGTLESCSSSMSTCSSTTSTASKGFLQCMWNGGMPYFVFTVANEGREIYVATPWKVSSSNDKTIDRTYLFHSQRYHQKIIGRFDANDLVGKMKVSSSLSFNSDRTRLLETEFVLFGVSSALAMDVQGSTNFLKNVGLPKKMMDIFKLSYPSKHKSRSYKSSQHKSGETFSCSDGTNIFDKSSLGDLLEDFPPPNFELAAIVIRDQQEDTKECLIGGWGLKFLEKTTSDEMNAYVDVSIPSMSHQESSKVEMVAPTKSINVLVPAGVHGGPTKKDEGPSSLIERWKSGGQCDCGGWDVGCPLTILSHRAVDMDMLSSQQDCEEVQRSLNLFTKVDDTTGCKDRDDSFRSNKEASPLENLEPTRKKLRPSTSVGSGGMSPKCAFLRQAIAGSDKETEVPSNNGRKYSSTAQVSIENGTRHIQSLDGKGSASAKGNQANTIEIVSSTTGSARLLVSCNAVDCPGFQMPDLQSVIKKVEDSCLGSYKFLGPDFSLTNIMKELCDTLLEMGSEPMKKPDLARTTPILDSSRLSCSGGPASGVSTCHTSSSAPGSRLPHDPHVFVDGSQRIAQMSLPSERITPSKHSVPETSGTLVLYQHESASSKVQPVHDPQDITKGEERVRISVVNDVNSVQYPPHFGYIQHNIVYQNAQLMFSLARIGDENCCPNCFEDCLSAPIPCACARETGGVYAYTPDGLLRKEFLADCMLMKHEPEQHQLFYCKDCPLEKTKNELTPDPCKGHLLRKFIKECWSKCGCAKNCGNRVVQRGISFNLQVFFTSERKGWGLRTVDDLPRGAFVCEYVGEILTNMELYHRTIKLTGNARHTYPVLLDADWGSEGVLDDEEALCLDATFYGNVARFINHRCGDANLVEIPVEVETPDHHYYHLALFTARKVEAFEELTWDYGIDFDDENHPLKAFRCCCGSKFCRDRRRSMGKKSGAFIVR